MTVYLIRHAKAGDRDTWRDDDRLRPLSGRGHRQSRLLIDMLQDAKFDRVLSINLRGPYFLTQASARWMIAQKQADASWRGCIVNVSSISATVASPSRGEYCLSKAGVSMATQLWAVRLGEYGIAVYEIRPGLIQTDMTAAVRPVASTRTRPP